MGRMSLVVRHLVFVLLLGLGGRCFSADIGDWTVDFSGENPFAKTTNESGAVLMYYCFAENDTCVWAVKLGLSCEKDMITPALVSSSSGAANLSLRCFISENETSSTIYLIDQHDFFSGIARDGVKVAIVVATESDQFKVLRFSLRGSASAMKLVEKMQEKKLQNPNSTKDTYL